MAKHKIELSKDFDALLARMAAEDKTKEEVLRDAFAARPGHPVSDDKPRKKTGNGKGD